MRTKKGSAMVKRSNGNGYVSPRPMFYGSGLSSMQGFSYVRSPILWGAVAGAGTYYFYSRNSRPDCFKGEFAYGSSCRTCSDWECPIGQYRAMGTPHTDSYCRLCTNAPADTSDRKYVYMTPGNNNDCQYKIVLAGSSMAGVEACEKQGYGQAQCEALGNGACCRWDFSIPTGANDPSIPEAPNTNGYGACLSNAEMCFSESPDVWQVSIFLVFFIFLWLISLARA